MKTFVAQNIEIAECELRDAGLPITQEGAEKLATQMWRGTREQRRQRKLDGCYRSRRGHGR